MVRRRTILVGGAALLVLGGGGMVVAGRAGSERYARFAAASRRSFAVEGGIRELVRYATLAANGHNTQPWRFRESAEGIAILPDFSRRTPVVDPDDHHLYVSLGCAIENLAIAAAATGRTGEVLPLADSRDGARYVFGGASSAAIDADLQAMFAAIPQRQSTRSAYDGRAVPAADLARLQRSATVEGTALRLLAERKAVDKVRDLVAAGNDEQMADPAFMRELKAWLRFNPASAMEKGDGLYAVASGNPSLPEWIGRAAFDFVVTPARESNKYRRQLDSSAGVAVFSAADAGPAGWLAVGRACQRFCLAATALGIKTAFVNQPVEVARLRGEMAAIAGIAGRRPDLVLRFGYAPAMTYSPRRPVDAVLDPQVDG